MKERQERDDGQEIERRRRRNGDIRTERKRRYIEKRRDKETWTGK